MNGMKNKTILVVTISVVTALLTLWFTSFEARLGSKVDEKTFDVAIRGLQKQSERIESHIWDIMQSQGIRPSIPVPDEIKNNHKMGGV